MRSTLEKKISDMEKAESPLDTGDVFKKHLTRGEWVRMWRCECGKLHRHVAGWCTGSQRHCECGYLLPKECWR